jgi:phage shock protein A
VVIENERRLAVLEKREQRLRALQAESGEAVAELHSQIELALSSGNDALCRALVRKKLEEENRGRDLERLIKRLADAKAELAKQLSERREKLENMVKKMEAYAPLDSDAGNDDDEVSDCVEPRRRVVTEEDVEVAMLKLKQAYSTERKR